MTRGLVRVLGDGNVAHLSADDYHRYDRHERRGLGITPLHPDANYLDILTQHLGHLRRGHPVLKPEGCVGCGVCVTACVTLPSSLKLRLA